MITNLSHMTVFVRDADEAKSFYVDRLGFEVRADMQTPTVRWLTVSPPNQPEVEIVLMVPGAGPQVTREQAEQILELASIGALGPGVFRTENCQESYETYRERGVEFVQPPTQEPYGIEALFKDDSGNLFSLVELPR